VGGTFWQHFFAVGQRANAFAELMNISMTNEKTRSATPFPKNNGDDNALIVSMRHQNPPWSSGLKRIAVVASAIVLRPEKSG